MKPLVSYTGNGAANRTVFHDIGAANDYIARLEVKLAACKKEVTSWKDKLYLYECTSAKDKAQLTIVINELTA